MNTIQYGLRNYRNHETANKPQASHPLDILSSILFDIKTDNRSSEGSPQKRDKDSKEEREEFSSILKKEMAR